MVMYNNVINRVSIVNNHNKLYQKGYGKLGKTSILVGISPGNGYFSESNIISILSGMCKHSPFVYILVPGEIHIHNFIGIGYPADMARKKAKRDINQTNNRLDRAVNIMQTDLSIDNFRIIDWLSEIERNMEYKNNLCLILEEYNSNQEFQLAVNTITYRYMSSRAKNRKINRINVSEGVLYYLKELSLFASFATIFGEKIIIAYYKVWGDDLVYIEKLFPDFTRCCSMIQYEISKV
ncbi:tRNA-dependent cyclodipeptide synthase [Zooshikella harenae]|uniref:Cyclodipeptide synthase n=1 Tax=Zooshikella harenae TaxID=2827238 RepID=A0ABS5ZHS2_9GAMM|nr:tRNA-dependent cyclodipeptide synthase [Zooshikella harenae]MBU2712557.1 tRNA-dependent cyclodipeptide synthase [Zooshikella harenae]